MTTAIETSGLTKRFLRHQAVREVTLALPRGAALALVGSNGAGKTTLMKMLVNILAPDSGEARVMGKDSRALRAPDFRRIGYLSENQRLPRGLTVAQYFDYLRPLYPDWDRALEADLRTRMDLPPGRKLGKLSHGMRMKTMLTGVLAFRPPLLILDEPLTGLDPLVRDEIVEGLLSETQDTTLVISSHELTEIEGFVTHVAFMDNGALRFLDAIGDMAARFRRVSVTLADGAPAPDDPPASWLDVKRSGHALEFVDSAFADERRLASALSIHLGPVHGFEAEPMTLRDISKTLMRAAREGALQ